MSNSHLRQARKIKAGSASNKAVLNCLCDHANEAGQCWPEVRTIVDETELGRATVFRSLADLERRGLITRQRRRDRGGQISDIYTVTLHSAESHDETHAEYHGETRPVSQRDSASLTAGLTESHSETVEEAPSKPQKKKEPTTADAVSFLEAVIDPFDLFWNAYPHKVDKIAAEKELRKIIKAGKVQLETILRGLETYKQTKPAWQNWKGPAAWLRDERWDDHRQRPAPSLVTIRPGTEQWQAWRDHTIASGRSVEEMDKRAMGDMELPVPSKWPPSIEKAAA